MMIASVKSLLKVEYDDSYIYVHNLSGFDSVYLLKYMLHMSDNKHLNPVMRGNSIISLDFKALSEDEKLIKLHFRDSLNLLPQSLRKLAKATTMLSDIF